MTIIVVSIIVILAVVGVGYVNHTRSDFEGENRQFKSQYGFTDKSVPSERQQSIQRSVDTREFDK